ncbi:transcriptional-regulating factor 1-like isoform X2 [Boleophthalmus pectinirostris]|uniref:transcriptional-regulating factor 1-like isoform X2 n=1 Tax=Boleophthalmus pectinirostris TaxID=150288 RepID=UPI00242F3E61|nr:transcriptional-regulating factor 1-like isoform X2 [Boleophthalmus pectinirostris]
MTDPRPFPPLPPPPPSSSASPRMHPCALPPSAFMTSPPPLPPQHHHHHHNHHQPSSQFMNQSQTQHHFAGQNLDTALESSDWSPAQFPSMLSGYTEQEWDLPASSQNLFNSAFNYDSFQSDVFHYPDPQCLQSNNYYPQTSSTADMSHWGAMEPTTPQLQCSSLGYTSRDAALGSWSSTEYNFTSNTDSFIPFYPNSYQENQNFLSPSTPGPSPHYPPSFVTSPTSENCTERLAYQTFVEPGMFTVNSETANVQNDVIQKQTKPRKTTRGRGGGGAGGGGGVTRPRKSRTDKKKVKDSPEPPVLERAAPERAAPERAAPERPAPVDIAVVTPPSLQRRCVMAEVEELEVHEEQSQNRSLMRVAIDGGRSHYRPPPILSPTRAGAGLHWALANKCSAVAMETASLGTLTSETTAPCINVGRSFQAEIPKLRARRHAHSDSHNALLLWRPLNELEPSENQQRVEALLKFAQSSAVPGGGTKPEDVLLLLSQNRGDFLLTVEKLLTAPKSTKKRQAPRRHSPVTPSYS